VTVHSGKRSGTHQGIYFRRACNKHLRLAVDQFAFCSLRQSEWARPATTAIANEATGTMPLARPRAKWVKILFVLWTRQVASDEEYIWPLWRASYLRQAA